MNRLIGIAGAAAVVACGVARGDITITSMSRVTDTRFARVGLDHRSAPPHNESNTQAGPWFSDITSTLDALNFCRAAQTSDISPERMSAQFLVQTADSMVPSMTDEQSAASSSVDVSFHVDTPTEVYFSAQQNPGGVFSESGNIGPPFLSLRHTGAEFLALTFAPNPNTPTSAVFQGVLQPGDYQIHCITGFERNYRPNGPSGGTMTAGFQFIVPAPASGLLLLLGAAGLARRRR
jgi:hypothetical protein